MFKCPGCGLTQARTRVFKGVLWVCPQCGGRAGTIGLLRRTFERPIIERYWWSARRRKTAGRTGRPCPVCALAMREIDGPPGSGLPPLEICKHCQIFWFDPGEYRAIPQIEKQEEPPPPPPHPVLDAIRASREARKELCEPHPVEKLTWQVAFAAVGCPIEIEAPVLRRLPMVTITLVATLIVVGLLSPFFDFDAAVQEFGFQAAHPWRLHGLTLLTTFFLHSDPIHLMGNVYFLGLVGDNVEDFLGRWTYTVLLIASTIAANLLLMVFTPAPFVVAIGASGGIAGLLTFYALRFPRARLAEAVFPLPVAFSARLGLLIWFALQLTFAATELHDRGTISGLAHLGGGLMGVLFWAGEELYSRAHAALSGLRATRSLDPAPQGAIAPQDPQAEEST